jgi:hypothetical protein
VTKRGEGQSPTELYINKTAGEGRSSGTTQQPGAGKLAKLVVGGKLHRRAGKAHFPNEL